MMDADDRKLFEDSLRKAVDTHAGAALDAALGGLGWRHALDEDRHVAVATLFRLQGEANATSAAIDDVLLAAIGVDESVAIVLPPIGRYDAPGSAGFSVTGIATQRIETADSALVVSTRDDGAHIAVVVPTGQLTLRRIGGLDPALGLVEVHASLTSSDGERVSWQDAVAAGQLALAHELTGAAAAMLRLARDHAVQRVQFGAAIASFQAVRHRLADALVAVEAADAATAAAWADPSPLAALLAKAIAGRSARVVSRHAQQVLGGMGFTSEHPLHRYLRRTMSLDQLLGSSRLLTAQVGEEIVRTRQVPSMLPL